MGGIFKNLGSFIEKSMKDKKDEDEDEEDEDEDEDEEDEDDEDDEDENDKEDEDEDEENDKEEDEDSSVEGDDSIYLLYLNNSLFRYTKTYTKARLSMLNEAHEFLTDNVELFFRMEKEENSITIYERNPNSLSPYQEKEVFKVNVVNILKY